MLFAAGVARTFPPPIRTDEARPDLVIATRWHEDHLDLEGIPVVAKHSRCSFMGLPSCVSRMLGWGIPRVGGLRVYHSGETKYDLRLRALAYDMQMPPCGRTSPAASRPRSIPTCWPKRMADWAAQAK